MPYDSLVRTKQLNQPELSGYIVNVLLQYLKSGTVTGIAMNTGQLTGQFYPLNINPSGYVTTGQLTGLATQQFVTGNNATVLSYVAANYYSSTNPSGYIGTGYVSTGLLAKSGATYVQGTDVGFSIYDSVNHIPVIYYTPNNTFQLTGPNGGVINFDPGDVNSSPYISGMNLYTTGINGQAALGSGDINRLFVSWKYFTTGSSLSFNYFNLNDTLMNGTFVMDQSQQTYLQQGYHLGYPSEQYLIDYYGNQASSFGLTYTRPTIYGFDISGQNISSNGYRVLTSKDGTGYATYNQLLVTSGQIENDLWTVYTNVTNLLTGTGQSLSLYVSGQRVTGNATLSGIGGMQVSLSGNNVILFSGGALSGPYISGIVVNGQSFTGQVNITGISGVTVTPSGNTIVISSPTGNYVTLNTAQTITGIKTFTSPVYVSTLSGTRTKISTDSGRLYANNGSVAVDWSGSQSAISGAPWGWNLGNIFVNTIGVNNTSGPTVIDITNNKFYGNWSVYNGTLGVGTITGVGCQLAMSGTYIAMTITGGTWSVDFGNRILYDQGGHFSVDFNNRQLWQIVSGAGFSVLNWQNKQLSGVWDVGGLTISGVPISSVGGGGGTMSGIIVTGTMVSGNVGITGIGGTLVYLSGNNVVISGGSSINTGNFITTSMTGAFAPENIGLPTDGVYGGPNGAIAGVTVGDRHEDAFDKIETILGLLAPSKPLNLSNAVFSFSGTSYSAYMQGTASSFSPIFNSQRVSGFSTGFYNGAAGALSGYINGLLTGAAGLTTGIDTGNYTGLHITADFDYWSGVAGKAGFWYALSANVYPTGNLNTGIFTMQMVDSTTGPTATITGYCDAPQTTSANWIASGTGNCAFRYVDGIISFTNGDQVWVKTNINNAVGAFYSNPMGQLTCPQLSTVNLIPTGTPISGTVMVLSGTQTVNNTTYVAGATITIATYNSASQTSSSGTVTNFRIDTNSNQQAQRRFAGTGQFPLSGYDISYDNTVSLSTNEELQMVNSAIQYPPKVNYGTYIPSGANYTNIPSGTYSSGYRWAFFDFGNLSNNSNVQVTFNGATNFGATTLTPGIALYVKVSGGTNGWVDGNAAYPAVGNPTNNGDPALVIASSNATVKYITFGTALMSGPVYVRIGLPSGSTKTFTSVSLVGA